MTLGGKIIAGVSEKGRSRPSEINPEKTKQEKNEHVDSPPELGT